MQRFLHTLTIVLILILCRVLPVEAQWINQQQLTQNIYLHNLAHPSPAIFVHFDKTIYTNNETVWFTGYLLKCSMKELAENQVLSVALVRDIDSTIVKQDKYAIENGFSYGSMVLPDTMITGNYHFQVTTNRVRKGIPEAVFIQPVIIKTNIEPAFNASFRFLESNQKSHSKTLVLSVTSRDFRFLPKPAEITYKYGKVIRKAKTNASGEVIFSLDEQPDLADPNVYAKIKYKKDSSFINMPFPVTKRKATVRFYPEGGNMIESLPGYIAWEVKDPQSGTVALKAQLYKNDELIDTIETNSYGVGKFIINPEPNSRYKVRLLHSGFADSSYYLPKPLASGVSLMVKDAIQEDTLAIILRSNQPQKMALRIHDFKDTYTYYEVSLTKSRLSLKVPLSGMPKGLKAITISDSLGRPLAERMFFAHYEPRSRIAVSTDKDAYQQRQKVSLKLSLSGQDTLGMVSVACVQGNRLSARLSTDIESYAYLKNEMETLTLYASGRGYEEKTYIEDMMLVKGWRRYRYTWQEIAGTAAADTLRKYDSLDLKIKVTRGDKPLKNPAIIGMMRGTQVSFINTDPNGEKDLKNEDLLVESGKKIYAFINGPNQAAYTIKNSDPYISLNKNYLSLFAADAVSVPSAVQNNDELSLKNNEKVISLREVKITSGTDKNISYMSGSNECGDYVCRYNILNCRNHFGAQGNKPPEPGKSYIDGLNGGTTIYRNCKDERSAFVVPVQGIYTRKEFYVNDFSQPLEPAFVSTIYWNHAMLLNPKEQEITFYTSDITGKFRVVVQGITSNDVIYAQHEFEVKAK